MTATTFQGYAPASTETASRGFFGRMIDSMVAARMRQAEAYVNGHLLAMDDETLERAGFTRAELESRPHARAAAYL